MRKHLVGIALTCLTLAGCGAVQSQNQTSATNKTISLTALAKSAQATNATTNGFANSGTVAPSVEGIVPARIVIPAIHVDTNVQQVGLLTDGAMGVPTNDTSTAWYKNGAKPGQMGNAVIDGHVDSYKGTAIFFYLKTLNKGDKVYVTNTQGTTYEFAVTDIESYPRDNAPIARIFGSFGVSNLNLITCTGLFNSTQGTHEDRLVVYTTLVSTNASLPNTN